MASKKLLETETLRALHVLSTTVSDPAVLLSLKRLLEQLDGTARELLERGPTHPATQRQTEEAIRQFLTVVHELSGSLLSSLGEAPTSQLSEATVERSPPAARKRVPRRKTKR
jgi:hypothetical protein